MNRFTQEVQDSGGQADFLALEFRRDPVFNVLEAVSSENYIQATVGIGSSVNSTTSELERKRLYYHLTFLLV